MKKIFMLLALFVIGMTGCLKEEQSEETTDAVKASEEKVITVWAWDEAFNVRAAQLAAERYKKEHPEVEIRVVSKAQNDITEKLCNGLSSRIYSDLPDVVLIEDYRIKGFLTNYEDEFTELTSVISYDKFMDYKVDIASVNGRRYGVPFDNGVAVLFYRKDLIEAAGFEEKDMEDLTWERYIEIGRIVKEKTGIYMLTLDPCDLGILRIMLQSAGQWYVDKEGSKVTIQDNQALADGVRIYLQLLEEEIAYSVNDWDGFIAAFRDKNVATVVSGCWVSPTIKENKEQDGLWRVARIPRLGANPDSIQASNHGGSSWYILKNKEHAKEAKDFIKFMFGENEEFSNELIEEINLFSAFKDSGDLSNYQKADPFFGDQILSAFISEIAADIKAVNYGAHTYSIEEILSKELQTVLKGTPLEQALRMAQVKAEAILGSD